MSFHLTPAQSAAAGFLEAALNSNVPMRIRAISRAAHLWAEGRRGDWAQAHVHESSWRIWRHNPAFLAWYRDAWKGYVASYTWLLDKIGLEKARHDFRPPWRAMQEKYSPTPPGLPAEGRAACPQLTVIIRAPRPRRPEPA